MTLPTVLVADDDRSIRTVLTQALGPLGLPGAQHRQRRDAVALGGGRRGRPRHHRRGDAGRERPRPDPAHQAHPPRSAGDRDERAIHADDRGQGSAARRVRIPAEAVRPGGTAVGGRPRAGAPPRTRTMRPRRAARRRRPAAADRPQPGDAGGLSHHRPAQHRRSHGDDQRRVRHRQGTGRPRPARLRQAPLPARSSPSTWRRSRAN